MATSSPTTCARSSIGSRSVLRERPIEVPSATSGYEDASDFEDLQLWAWRDSNPLPPASEGGYAHPQSVAGLSKDAQLLRFGQRVSRRELQKEAPVGQSLGPSLVQGRHFLTVKEVAAVMRVCRATVYRLCSEGGLEHVRVANALRIPAHAVAQYFRTG